MRHSWEAGQRDAFDRRHLVTVGLRRNDYELYGSSLTYTLAREGLIEPGAIGPVGPAAHDGTGRVEDIASRLRVTAEA